jgi:hypothetical protein
MATPEAVPQADSDDLITLVKLVLSHMEREDAATFTAHTRQEADQAVGRDIDGFYNPIRRHPALDFTSPLSSKKWPPIEPIPLH